ncbi:DUF1311 domain-containing protein [Luteimonas sp. SX5]|uniref:DUF1311 domain-containing protein n=1 Tax=Luteimonas galliterrae TaxID=2940486 RepID=A0ABT0MK17_9GAMM|nr:lysozyme inhibitor LprI family protein [Luteimonas galliterrae]MCL1635214.1 DUF1311 domain-containing protein [Luteimonas galliterrae]
MRIALVFCLLIVTGLAATASNAEDLECMGMANDQYSINQCARKSADAADAQLNAVYRELIRAQSGDALAVAAIKNAQRAWIAFRDLEIESNFPAENKMLAYGSMYPQCHAMALESLTRVRTAQLCLQLRGQRGSTAACKAVDVTPKFPEFGC